MAALSATTKLVSCGDACRDPPGAGTNAIAHPVAYGSNLTPALTAVVMHVG